MPEKRERRTYTDEFKNQIVQLHLNGKQKSELIREYDLTPSALDRWIKQANASGSHFMKKTIVLTKKMNSYDFVNKTNNS